jgi:hypothetical protein
MRHPSIAVLSIAATVLWLAASAPASAGQRGRGGGPPPQVPASHPAPQSHGGGHGNGHAPDHPGNAKAGSSSTSTPSFVSRMQRNPQLTSRLTPLLPSGMSLESAAQGFRNQGQFIAALHVSKNVGIPFDQLKTEMTGSNHRSLGQAIETLKPNADATKEVKTAEDEAKEDVNASNRGRKAGSDTDKD